MGASVFSWAISPTAGNRATGPDWRFLGKRNTHYARHELPEDIAAKCVRLTRKLGLISASIDLALREDGSYQFFEINQGGRFLWGDELDIGIHQFDAFQELLLSGREDFVHKREALSKTYHDYLNEVDLDAEFELEMSQHFGRFGHQYSRASVKFL